MTDINIGQDIVFIVDNLTGVAASVSDIAYGSSWNGVVNFAPSKNTVYDKIETLADEMDTLAEAGVNSDITSMTGLDDDGIPLAKVANAASSGTNSDITSITGLEDSGIPLVAISGGSSSTKISNYTITTYDHRKLIILSSSVTSGKTFTLPSVGSANDGMIVYCLNDCEKTLTVTPSDSDSVWNSGTGYGIELLDKGTGVALRYDDSRTKWDIVHKWGGRVIIEGLKLQESMTRQDLYAIGGSYGVSLDDSKQRACYLINGVQLIKQDFAGFPNWKFDGSADYCQYGDDDNWDIFGNQTGHKTIALWIKHDALGTPERYISHYEDSSNYWMFSKASSDVLYLNYVSGGVTEIQIGAGAMSATTWYHVAVVIDGSDVGIYLDGNQVEYDGTWNTDTFSGNLYLGQSGSGASYFDGTMCDLHISYNNPYGANPNSGKTDSFTKPTALFQGVM